MSAISDLPKPQWLIDAPEEERASWQLGWLLDMCAAYAHKSGKMTALSEFCGFSPSAIGKAKHLGVISPEMAVQIESRLGRDVITREALCPKIFAIKD